jgi:hypothetical protein
MKSLIYKDTVMPATDKTKTIRLITCENIIEAYFIKNRLNNEGIDCFLTNEYFTNLLPNYFNLFGSGVQVFVFERDFEKSRGVIKDKFEPEKAEMICPLCGSTEIGLGFGSHKFHLGIGVLLTILVGVPIGNVHVRNYCKKCKVDIF